MKIIELNILDKRTLNITRNILPMLIYKIGSMIISLLYVPLLINTLSTEYYGVWLTITTLIVWISLFDIGLGNGLRNNLAKSIASNKIEEAQIYISTSYFLIFVLVFFFIIIFSFLNFFLDWEILLNVSHNSISNLKLIVSIVIYSFFIQFIFKLIDSILLAFQKPSISALIAFLGQLFSYLFVLFLVNYGKPTFLNVTIIISTIPILILIIFSFYLFAIRFKEFKPKFKLIKMNYKNEILSTSLKFFFLQIITIVIFQTNNFIIAHNLGQLSVTQYNISFKLIGIISIIFTIILTPIWSAATDAYYKNDYNWFNKTIKKLNFIWLATSILGFLIVFFSDYIYISWLGSKKGLDNNLQILFLIYFMINMRYGIYGYIINGIGKIYLQIVLTSIIAIVYIPTTLFFCSKLGLKGIVLSMIFFSSINAIWSYLQYKKLISNSALGIWNK